MNILLIYNKPVSPGKYGSKEKMIWTLAKILKKSGYKLQLLAPQKSVFPFGKHVHFNPSFSLTEQIPEGIDIVHTFINPGNTSLALPFVYTHTNFDQTSELPVNTIFSSLHHARLHKAEAYIYNGLDPEDYPRVTIFTPRNHLVFMGNPYLKRNNLRDAKIIAEVAEANLIIVGGYGLSFNKHIQYKGLVEKEERALILNRSKCLLHPIRWHEPFGHNIIESMYFGCPVLSTPYGSSAEIINPECGYISDSRSDLLEALKHLHSFNRKAIHNYTLDHFSAGKMAFAFLDLYEKVLDGHSLNSQQPVNSSYSSQNLLPVYF
ncbi:MAG: glycosyltransferase [Cytophagaceae bacterium]